MSTFSALLGRGRRRRRSIVLNTSPSPTIITVVTIALPTSLLSWFFNHDLLGIFALRAPYPMRKRTNSGMLGARVLTLLVVTSLQALKGLPLFNPLSTCKDKHNLGRFAADWRVVLPTCFSSLHICMWDRGFTPPNQFRTCLFFVCSSKNRFM